jgi:ubiquinone/menaquinone biosynthesis C-methylase UbiE
LRGILYSRLYAWACQRLYNELAWSYDAVSWLVSLGRWARWRRLALEYMVGERVLEVGFGTGELLLEMAQQGIAATGLELSPAMQRAAGDKLQRQNCSLARVQASAMAMPFADRAFDCVISTFPAGYILSPQTLRECGRVLRTPGGRLVIVGLWVSVDHPMLRRFLPLFYGRPGEEMWRTFANRLAEAGFRATVTEYEDGVARVAIVTAERCLPICLSPRLFIQRDAQ